MLKRPGAAGALLTLALALTGCTGSPAPEPVGDLAPITARTEGLQPLTTDVRIGTVTVTEDAALFDEPDGVTVGRIGPGDLAAVQPEAGWYRVVLPVEGEQGEALTAWLPASSAELRLG